LRTTGRPPVVAVLTGTQVTSGTRFQPGIVGLPFSDWLVDVQGGCVKDLEPLAAGIRTPCVGTPAEVLGGISGIAAGLCWVVKSTVILVSGWQPALIFELAPLLMSVAVQVLAYQLPVGRLRAVACVAGAGATVAAVGVLVDGVAPLPRLVAGSAIALANILILFSLLLSGVGLWRRMRLTLPLVIAGITVPAVLSGGLLAARFGERALEVPLAALGAAWVVFGGLLLQGRYRPGR
jgi:hypothetical protein